MSALKRVAFLVFGALLLVQPATAARMKKKQSQEMALEVDSGNGAVSFQEVAAEEATKTISDGAEAAEAELLCYQFEARLPDGSVMKVSRSKTYGQLFKMFAKVVVVTALVTGIVAMGMYTSGLFEAFLAANEGIPVHKIASAGGKIVSKTYLGIYYNKVAIATLTTTTAMLSGISGFKAGAVATVAANQIGVNWKAYQENQKVGDEIKWLSGLKDKCNYVHFDVLSDGKARNWKKAQVEGPWTQYAWGTSGIFALEKDSDAAADQALLEWCSFYSKHELFGKGKTMPMPAACEHVFKMKPEMRTCSGAVDESFKRGKSVPLTCNHLLSLSKDEMQFQVLMSQMSLLKTLDGIASQQAKRQGAKCGEKADKCANVKTQSAGDAAFCGLQTDDSATLCSGEEKGDILEEMEEIEQNKAAAIFDCLALSSCQLIRKSHDKIKGRVRSIGSFGFKTQKHIDMRTAIIKKCLSHNSLLGPVKADEVCIPGKDCPEDIKDVETDDDGWAAKTADEEEPEVDDDEAELEEQ